MTTEAFEIKGPNGPIPIRRLIPANGVGPNLIVDHHGAGYVIGSTASHDDLCAEMAEAACKTPRPDAPPPPLSPPNEPAALPGAPQRPPQAPPPAFVLW